MPTLAEFLKSKNYSAGLALHVPYDGTYHRFQRGGSDESGWIKGRHPKDRPEINVVEFGDWRLDERFEWVSHEPTTPEERAELEACLAESKREDAQAKRERQEKTAAQAQTEWEKLPEEGLTPYLKKKKIEALYGCKSYRGVLYVPLRDVSGVLWGYQTIHPDGSKYFLSGVRIRGNFHLLGVLPDPPTGGGIIYLCEGFATAASIHQATGGAVASAFNAGNLTAVAKEIRGVYPHCRLIVCADNDQWTTRPDGSAWNPGIEKAREAAQMGELVVPVFRDLGSRPTDFNDLHVLEGLDVVKAQVQVEPPSEDPGPEPQAEAAQAVGAGPSDPKEKKPKKKGLTEKTIADWLLNALGRDIIRQDKNLFMYDGKKWVELGEHEIDGLKNKINASMGNKLPSKDVGSIYKTFFRYVPHVPRGVNLYTPNPSCANFQNGTLHLKRSLESGLYTLEFLPHRREDYVTWVIPAEYPQDPQTRAVKNERFLTMLEETMEGDPDKAGKLLALQQGAGAALLPAFPQMFFLHGVSGSRKSTWVKCVLKLLSLDNVSFVDPTAMEGFQIEGMIGKLVNANLDIDDHVALPRGFLKRFEDNIPLQVNRKGKTVVNAKLPATHFYCANELPPNFEGASRALYRRVTLIRFTRDLTNDNRQGEIRFYEDLVFQESPQGLLNYALDGLEMLIAQGGKFTPPESSHETLRQWQLDRDPVGMFLECIQRGEIIAGNTQVIIDDAARVRQIQLWECFRNWHQESYNMPSRVTKFGFYKRIRNAGYRTITTTGYDYFLGIGAQIAPGAIL